MQRIETALRPDGAVTPATEAGVQTAIHILRASGNAPDLLGRLEATSTELHIFSMATRDGLPNLCASRRARLQRFLFNCKTWVLLGSPTTGASMPRSGSASYTTIVAGQSLEIGSGTGAQEIGGTASLDVDFASSTVKTELTLGQGVSQSSIGTFSGSGTITSDQFSGTFTSGVRYFTGGTFNGGFYGAAAQEAGYAFSIKLHNPDPGAGAAVVPMDVLLSGTVVGAKK
jgi:hypothetical protein